MKTRDAIKITVEATVIAPVEKVWNYWTGPKHICGWSTPSEDWHTPYAENDLRPGGKFLSRMEATDGSQGFDFEGIYDEVTLHQDIAYTIGDGRKVKVTFMPQGNTTRVIETFDAETTFTVEQQRAGWQAILDNFKKYTEQ